VQGELERALATVCDEPVRIAGAGRTDTGVHAIGQVMSFRTASALDGPKLGRGVNALLPSDIAISALEPCGDDFHARFSATGRTYEYRLRIGPDRDPLERWAYHHPAALRLDAMREASGALIGRADFAAFATGEAVSGTVRTVRTAEWTLEGELLRFEIEADAFLRGMVRAIVGTLLWVGRGKIGVERFGEILRSEDRAQAGPSAPARGLCLTRVRYGEGHERNESGREADIHDEHHDEDQEREAE
jgi:tRNA pseudouridine38-40 synthase